MNSRHMMLLLLIIFGGFMSVIYVKTLNLRSANNEIEELEDNLDFAAYSAVFTLAQEYGSDGFLYKVSDEFMKAYEVNSRRDCSDLWAYIPAFVFLDTNGFRCGAVNSASVYEWGDSKPYALKCDGFEIQFSLDDSITVITDNGGYARCRKEELFATNTSSFSSWQIQSIREVKNIFVNYNYDLFTEENYEKFKQSAIAMSISETVTELINTHNQIAGENGITYLYSTPSFLDVNTSLPSFVVCFQGYPLKINGSYYSSLVSRAGHLIQN